MQSSLDDLRLNLKQDSLWVLNFCLDLIMFGVAPDLKVSDFKRLIETPKALVAAWWGIWHIISGFIIAMYWSRRATSTQTA